MCEPGLDRAVVDVELLHVGQPALALGGNLHAVQRERRLDQPERAAHLVLVVDDRARGADDAAEHGLLEQVEARLGAEDLLLQLVDVLLQRAQPHRVGAGVGPPPAAGGARRRRRAERPWRRRRGRPRPGRRAAAAPAAAAAAPAEGGGGGASAACAGVASHVGSNNISSPQRKVPIPSDVMSLLRQALRGGGRTQQRSSDGRSESKWDFYQAAQVRSIPSAFQILSPAAPDSPSKATS